MILVVTVMMNIMYLKKNVQDIIYWSCLGVGTYSYNPGNTYSYSNSNLVIRK